jgi:hypothetical protein
MDSCGRHGNYSGCKSWRLASLQKLREHKHKRWVRKIRTFPMWSFCQVMLTLVSATLQHWRKTPRMMSYSTSFLSYSLYASFSFRQTQLQLTSSIVLGPSISLRLSRSHWRSGSVCVHHTGVDWHTVRVCPRLGRPSSRTDATSSMSKTVLSTL